MLTFQGVGGGQGYKFFDVYYKRHTLEWIHVDRPIVRQNWLGCDLQVGWEKLESHRDSHRKDMSPSTQGLNYRLACNSFTVAIAWNHLHEVTVTLSEIPQVITSFLHLIHSPSPFIVNINGKNCSLSAEILQWVCFKLWGLPQNQIITSALVSSTGSRWGLSFLRPHTWQTSWHYTYEFHPPWQQWSTAWR